MFRTLGKRWNLAKRGLSAALTEEKYSETVDGRDIRLTHSSFNPKWLKQCQIDPKVILELGSFDGGDALRFAKGFPNCKIISVEADPARYEIVKKNLSGSNIILENNAVCQADGPIPWFPATINGKEHGQGSIYKHTENYRKMFPNVKQSEQAKTVQGIRLDSLCAKHGITEIALLHMDIEGAEMAAIQSLGKIRPKVIFAEMCEDRYVDLPDVAATHQLLCDMGYSLAADLGADRLYIID